MLQHPDGSGRSLVRVTGRTKSIHSTWKKLQRDECSPMSNSTHGQRGSCMALGLYGLVRPYGLIRPVWPTRLLPPAPLAVAGRYWTATGPLLDRA